MWQSHEKTRTHGTREHRDGHALDLTSLRATGSEVSFSLSPVWNLV